MRKLAFVSLVLTAAACGGEDAVPPVAPIDDFPPPAEGEGYQMSFDVVAPAGEEIWLCEIKKFPGEGLQHITRVESKQNDFMHHMDVMALLFNLPVEDGVHDCTELYGNNAALMEEGIVMYAAQDAEQEIVLPEGVSAAVPGGLRVMHEIHYVNTTAEDVNVSSRINMYTSPAETITDNIWGSVVRDSHLNIPPMQEHVEWTRCQMNKEADILLVASHMHELGRRITIAPFDGQNVGDIFYENTDWESPFLLDLTDQPLHVKPGDGFEFHCHFDNNRPEEVNWGFGAKDEMCQIAIVHTPGDAEIACEVVSSSDGVLDGLAEN